MRVRVNGAELDLPSGAVVADAVRATGVDPADRGIAVALAAEVLPRERWGDTTLREGAAVEVVRAAAGG